MGLYNMHVVSVSAVIYGAIKHEATAKKMITYSKAWHNIPLFLFTLAGVIHCFVCLFVLSSFVLVSECCDYVSRDTRLGMLMICNRERYDSTKFNVIAIIIWNKYILCCLLTTL